MFGLETEVLVYLVIFGISVLFTMYTVHLVIKDQMMDNKFKILWVLGLIFTVPIMSILYLSLRNKISWDRKKFNPDFESIN